MEDCINRIKEFELPFSDNHYDGNGNSAFTIKEGHIPVMVSAAHAVNHFREGKVKWADMYTGGIATYLHEKTGCHLIYSCKFTESDPNYDMPGTNKYQDALMDYLGSHKIQLLLDLHGASQKREYAVEMGTAPEQKHLLGEKGEEDPSLHNHKFIDDVIKKIFEDRFKGFSLEQKQVWKNIIFDAGDQNTITKYISQNTDTDCIQLEINGKYRNPDNCEEFVGLVESLIRIIQFFSKLDWTNDQEGILNKLYE